ncbi:MAG: DUF1800 domain-containing protein [Burkholderiales bacterium]|nr:MAG: DUF1800 domain-containing protein [Burkholderiales bacterium]
MQDTTITRSKTPPIASAETSDLSLEASSKNPSSSSLEDFSPHALTLLASALLAACGGGGGSGGGGDVSSAEPPVKLVDIPNAPGFNNFPKAINDNETARFLLQAQFSATAAEVSASRTKPFSSYLQLEFAKPIRKAWDWLEQQGYGDDATIDKYVYNNSIADMAVWRDLMSAPDALRKRVSLALSEFFVVSHSSMEIDWRGYAMAAYWDTLNEHAFGNFRNLLEAVTLSPAMGHFLNTRGNQKEDGKGRLPDENYAREVMQLFTIGVYELNLDGSVKTNAGKQLETYDSDDVSQLARVFTGYDYDKAFAPNSPNGRPFPGGKYSVWGRGYARASMTLDSNRHSNLPVDFLSAKIAANTDGKAALKTALDTLFDHPNVGPFFGRQMIQRLVTSNPSQAYVARVASAFNNNGAGIRGDMKAVWTAILLDDEARGPSTLANNGFGKLREPIVRFVQWARSFQAKSEFGTWKLFDLSDTSDSLGQSPLRSPSVFNFFRPGYVPPGIGVTAPEFQLVNETTVGGYLNFMQNAIRQGIYTSKKDQTVVDYGQPYTPDFVANYDALTALITNTGTTATNTEPVARAIVTQLNAQMCAGQLNAASLTIMINALRDGMVQRQIKSSSSANDKRETICAALLMILACPDYLIQK